jgi:2-polyprenyl-6-hydroxyphenyl methylase/3-demethylubiquinone-9 3-methyltransferase
MKEDVITFSFGKNWKDYLATINETIIAEAGTDLDDWLGRDFIEGKRVIDVGSGSGLSSLCLWRRRPRELVSFDYDIHSVEATQTLRSREGAPEAWKAFQGSILDGEFVKTLGKFDIVYSWGVLHHTGEMWKAMENAASLCAPDGQFWISIYQAGSQYEADLELKRRYNRADEGGKRALIEEQIAMHKSWCRGRGEPEENWNKVDGRGMNKANDIVDWLGGLPYEVAWPAEIVAFCTERGFAPVRVLERGQGGCSVYLFRKNEDSANCKVVGYRFETINWSSPVFQEMKTMVEFVDRANLSAVEAKWSQELKRIEQAIPERKRGFFRKIFRRKPR